MSLIVIAEFNMPIEADMARLNLAAQGIESYVFDGGMASLGLGLMTPARLMVDEDDADQARAVLAHAESGTQAAASDDDDDDDERSWDDYDEPEGA